MTEYTRKRLLARLSDGVPEMEAYRSVGLRLDSDGEVNTEVCRRLARDARFKHEYLDAYTRGKQLLADRDHPFRY